MFIDAPRFSRAAGHAALILAAIATSAALGTSCSDDFTEVAVGQILVSRVGGEGGAISDGGELRFEPVRVGFPADNQALIIENSSDEGDLEVESVVMTTQSPWLSMVVNGEPATVDGDTHTFEPEGGMTIGPRDVRQIDLRYEPQETDTGCGTPPEGKSADWCGTLTITSSDRDNGVITIDLIVPELGGDLQVCLEGNDCGELLTMNFNSAAVGDPAQVKRFTIANVGANDLRVSSISVSYDPPEAENDFTVDGPATPLTLPPDGSTQEYVVTFEPSADLQSRSATIEISSDGNTVATGRINITVGESNTPQINVTPESLTFVNVQNPDSDTQELTITNEGGPTSAPLTVTFTVDPRSNPDYSVYDAAGDPRGGARCQEAGAPDSCTTPLVIPRQESHVISVTYSPQGADPTDATLRISSNDPDPGDAEIDIPLTASGGTGVLVADQATLVWSNPAPGSMTTMDVTLTNEGNAPVNITAVALQDFTPADSEMMFDVSHDMLPITLAPTDPTTISVTFNEDPNAMDPRQSRIGNLVVTNDGASSEVIVGLEVQFP